MTTLFFLEAPIALVPVAAFLGVLLHFDSYKLVSFREVVGTLAAGAAMALVCYLANDWAMGLADLDFTAYSHYIAPLLEEAMKSSVIVYLFVRNRIGFKIDAAIMGFAIGTGFAMVENLYYLYALPDANLGTWIVRGFGTAIMHGGTTALFGVVAQYLIERQGRLNGLFFLPGFAAAVALHFIFNQFDANPGLGTIFILFTLPPGFALMFTKAERGVHTWLVHDYASHEHLLDEIRSGQFKDTEVGRHIMKFDQNFGSEVVAEMFLYIQVHTELVLKAERLTLARETEMDVIVNPEDIARLNRLRDLEVRIGKTALMALKPHLHFSRRELWEIHELQGEARRVSRALDGAPPSLPGR
jgi:RsiW-degrading membrane proteinase PrsW (M82 family)